MNLVWTPTNPSSSMGFAVFGNVLFHSSRNTHFLISCCTARELPDCACLALSLQVRKAVTFALAVHSIQNCLTTMCSTEAPRSTDLGFTFGQKISFEMMNPSSLPRHTSLLNCFLGKSFICSETSAQELMEVAPSPGKFCVSSHPVNLPLLLCLQPLGRSSLPHQPSVYPGSELELEKISSSTDGKLSHIEVTELREAGCTHVIVEEALKASPR